MFAHALVPASALSLTTTGLSSITSSSPYSFVRPYAPSGFTGSDSTHGSRFEACGRVVNGPANSDLAPADDRPDVSRSSHAEPDRPRPA